MVEAECGQPKGPNVCYINDPITQDNIHLIQSRDFGPSSPIEKLILKKQLDYSFGIKQSFRDLNYNAQDFFDLRCLLLQIKFDQFLHVN